MLNFYRLKLLGKKISQVENMLNKINGRLDTAGKKMGDLEDIARETIQNVRHTEKNSKNKEQTEEHQ